VYDRLNRNSVGRRQNLLCVAGRTKGSITVDSMKEVISAPPWRTEASSLAPDTTSYQIMVVPEDLRIRVRIPRRLEWAKVDLQPLVDQDWRRGPGGTVSSFSIIGSPAERQNLKSPGPRARMNRVQG
jgi:hypothetical protein